MLSREDNKLLTQCGPGTPMGNLMREYWVPALASKELPAPDCDPVRVLLLGERLIAFRDSSGRVGLLPHTCPHRGASLFFGRNEENGLRCIYHGWKFDVVGKCVDMPSEPPESDFKHKVRARAYPCVERAGIVWAYLGPRAEPPPVPEFQEFDLPDDQLSTFVYQRECNWLQALEGDIDTSHAGFLHLGHADPDDAPDDTWLKYVTVNRAPKYKILDTEFGATYGAFREAGDEDHYYWRIAHFLFPFFTMTPTGVLGARMIVKSWVPMDDEHVMMFQFGNLGGRYVPEKDQKVIFQGSPRTQLLPNTTDWYGRFRTVNNPRNDYAIDREKQRKNIRYSGMDVIQTEDQAVTESMGEILNRSIEHLGTSDIMVIRVRRRLLAAIKRMQKDGTPPPIVDKPTEYQQRSGGVVLPRDADWMEATADLRRPGSYHPELNLNESGGV